ncbi:hypothetical protein AB6A40_000255 [Gnathostoma spinigerum]|uniref:Aminopeptidase N-like N-terminal domain-containing protein n=1 Tax=Gnathostoma spinigerum TaxID=75299 RepID=A0ABD6E3Q6_9BILA
MAKSTTVRFRMRSPCGFHAFLVIIVITLAVVALLLIYLPSIRSGSQSRLLTDDTELASFFRLPTEIVPYHYDVNLKVYLPYQPYLDYGNQNYTLDGIVQIFVCCEKSTRQIVLNARSLIFDIMEVRVFDEYNRSLAILSFNQYENRIISIVKLDMVEPLTAGMNYMLFMKYHGTVGDVWSGGMFRAFYDDKHGTTRCIYIICDYIRFYHVIYIAGIRSEGYDI